MNGTALFDDEALAVALLLDDVAKARISPIDRERKKVIDARDAIKRTVGEFFAHLSLHLATLARGVRKKREEDPIAAAVDAADFDALGNVMEAHLRDVAKDAAALGLDQVGAGTHTNLTQANERAVAWAAEQAGELIGDISETTKEGVRDLVARALSEGWSNDDLADALLDSGVFAASRAETIARTETAGADVAGNLIGWQESGLVSGKEWKTGDDACDECQELDGEVVGIDDEFPDGDPPLHPNCVLPGALVSAAGVSAHYKRWFRGEVVRIRVETGHDLAITPNHPVLSQRGWIAAGALREGDDLVEATDPGVAVAAMDPDNHHVQTRIEQIADALVVAGGVATYRVPSTPEQFHGDSAIGEDVDVVFAHRALQVDAQAPAAQKIRKPPFVGADLRKEALLGRRDLAPVVERLLFAANSIVGGSRNPGTVLRGHARHSRSHGAAYRPHLQAGASEGFPQGRAVATEFVGKIDTRLAGHVAGVDGRQFRIDVSAPDRSRLRLRARLVAGLPEPANDHLRGDIQPTANGIDRLTGLVRPVKVVDIRRSYWAGHVYNLQTAGGWYFASGIVVHNCRCDILPVLAEDDDG